MRSSSLLSVGADAKTVKGEKVGYKTAILYLSPHTLVSPQSLCPYSTSGCRSVCLYSAGRGRMESVVSAREDKTRYFVNNRVAFINELLEDIASFAASTRKAGFIPCVRLNGTSDIKWENTKVIEYFPDIQFYDYTKYPVNTRKNRPPNYHLTYSYSSDTKQADQRLLDALQSGINVAVVFSHTLPQRFKGYIVVDGDVNDLRFLDPTPRIVGLRAKGDARKGSALVI